MYFIKQEECINNIIQSLPLNTIEYIFLIGSYAKGTNTKNSDIDLIVVSDCFKDISGYLRKKIVSTWIDNNMPKVDIVCLTENEFKEYECSQAYKDESLQLLFKGDTL